MNNFYFEYAPECLVIVDYTSTIISSNRKAREFFGKDMSAGMQLKDMPLQNTAEENIFDLKNIQAYFEFDFENREITYRNQEGYLFHFLLSSERVKIDDKLSLFLSFKNITDFVSYKNIFEELYNSLSTKTIELDDVLAEKENAYKMLKQKDDEMLRQLILAKDVQRGLFPELNKVINDYEIATKIQPATMISGDMVVFYEPDKDTLDIVVADVTGHGIPAALVTMLLKMSLQTSSAVMENPIDILNKLHNDMHNILSNSAIFVTVMYARMNTRTGEVNIINCGHPSPIIVHSDGSIERSEVGGMMLGVVERLDYSTMTITIEPDDLLIFITDGVTEASNDEEEFFEEKLLETFSRNRALSPKEIIETVMTSLYAHTGKTELQDDVSIVCIKK